jgi:hypothetical protein
LDYDLLFSLAAIFAWWPETILATAVACGLHDLGSAIAHPVAKGTQARGQQAAIFVQAKVHLPGAAEKVPQVVVMAVHEIVGVDLDAMGRKLLAAYHRFRDFEVFALFDDDRDLVPLAPVERGQPFGGRPRQRQCEVGLGPEARRVAHLGRLVGIACYKPGSLRCVLVERCIEGD